MGCIIIELKHKINPLLKKKFFLKLLSFGYQNLKVLKYFLQK
nr:MAG TPA: hypothetical protein [Caudoviricetes sp.]